MKKLIGTTDFVLEQAKLFKKDGSPQRMIICEDHANFLNQTPILGMFVPCDEDGKVLEKPKLNDYSYNSILSQMYCDDKKQYHERTI